MVRSKLKKIGLVVMTATTAHGMEKESKGEEAASKFSWVQRDEKGKVNLTIDPNLKEEQPNPHYSLQKEPSSDSLLRWDEKAFESLDPQGQYVLLLDALQKQCDYAQQMNFLIKVLVGSLGAIGAEVSGATADELSSLKQLQTEFVRHKQALESMFLTAAPVRSNDTYTHARKLVPLMTRLWQLLLAENMAKELKDAPKAGPATVSKEVGLAERMIGEFLKKQKSKETQKPLQETNKK